MVKFAALFTIILLASGSLAAQDTLPKFTVSTKGNNRVLISWTNNYSNVTQISIQRSTDSLRNFKTILSVPDASIPQNGFVDTKAATLFMFYRLFIVLDSGKYVFTMSKRPFWDTARIASKPNPLKNGVSSSRRVIISDSMEINEANTLRDKLNEKPLTLTDSAIRKIEPEKFFAIKRRDSILFLLPEKGFKAFRDSVVYKTKDTMVFRSSDTILIKPFIPKEVFKASIYIFSEKDGNISISLPDASTRKYSVKFFDEKNNPLFEIIHIKENSLLLDKSNFLRAGWFRFELYEDGKLKEKNKFFVPKDF